MRIQQTIAALCVTLFATVTAEQPRFLGGGGDDLSKFSSSSGDVVFSHPRDWRSVPVLPPTLVTLTKSGDDIAFTIVRVDYEFPQSYNDAFVEYETQELRKQYATAKDFTSRPMTHRTLGEMLQVDFTSAPPPGRSSRALRHRFLVVPAGTHVYRIMCVARADQFAKRHEPVFARVLDSIVITPPAKAQSQ